MLAAITLPMVAVPNLQAMGPRTPNIGPGAIVRPGDQYLNVWDIRTQTPSSNIVPIYQICWR